MEADDGATGVPILLWVAAYVLHRSAILLLGFDGVFYWEEAYRLLVAESWLGGWGIPLTELQADPYTGGSLVLAFLATPAVALFGPSILVLKGVALAWSTLGFVAWVVLVRRYFGKQSADLFALVFILAPPIFIVYNLIAMGSHEAAVTLAGLQLLLAYRVLFGSGAIGPLVLWGVFSGWSVWFAYVSAIPFALCVLVALARGVLPARRWPVLALAFSIGFAPWIAYNVATDWSGLGVVGTTFGTPREGFLARLADLLAAGLPAGLEYHDARWPFAPAAAPVPWSIFAYPHYLLLVGAWLWCAVACARGRERDLVRGGVDARAPGPVLVLVAIVPAFIALIAASNQVFDASVNRLARVPFLAYRVLVPALPAALVMLALALARLRGRARQGALLAVIVLGAIASARIVLDGAETRPRIERETRTLGANAMGQLIVYRHGPDVARAAAVIARLPDELREAAFEGVGFAIAYHHPAERPPEDLARTAATAPVPYRPAIARGMRLAFGPGMDQVSPVAPDGRAPHVLRALESL